MGIFLDHLSLIRDAYKIKKEPDLSGFGFFFLAIKRKTTDWHTQMDGYALPFHQRSGSAPHEPIRKGALQQKTEILPNLRRWHKSDSPRSIVKSSIQNHSPAGLICRQQCILFSDTMHVSLPAYSYKKHVNKNKEAPSVILLDACVRLYEWVQWRTQHRTTLSFVILFNTY